MIKHIEAETAVVGGGPAGLCAAIAAAESGARVVIFDRNAGLGGQLLKQTHMFFGSREQYAAVRGLDIAAILTDKAEKLGDRITFMPNSTVLGVYEDGMLTVEKDKKYMKFKPRTIIVAAGASEKFLAFPNNDLPGIYGAGAVQTLMNIHGVKPGDSAVMAGAGNIGLIVSYQLMQAGVKVKAVIDAAPKIGGFLVHASKIRRMGVPIYVSHAVKEAHGKDRLERVTITRLDEGWNPVPGTETDIEADLLCVSVGLNPLTELLWQAGCEMRYVPELGGYVPLRNAELRTTAGNIYVCGDAGGVEEASSAMAGGRLAGLCAARAMGYDRPDFAEQKAACIRQLDDLRSGPAGERVRAGIRKIEGGLSE